jgi:hypothetical protein
VTDTDRADDETILSTDPFEARFAFDIDGDTFVVTVDEDLSVVEVTRHGSGSN